VLLALALALCASAPGRPAGAQEARDAGAQPAAARQIDEYGPIRHCDMTARLDNFAIELQNDPGASALLVAYDAKAKGGGRAAWHLKVGRYYLVNVRGIDASRVSVVNAGSRDAQDVSTQLWLVPSGAEPPLATPAEAKYSARDFSGKLDTYATDELIYREQIEMGYSGEDISRSEFAERLKRQPDSLGYLVISTSKQSLPGAWRRVARREEQLIQKDYGIDAGRLASVYGGKGDGELAEVALWILPKSAPPPEGVKEPAEVLRQAVRLNRLDSYGQEDEEAEDWVVGNMAEALRSSPRAVAVLISREPMEVDFEGADDMADEAEAAEPTGEPADESMKGWAEGWKKKLIAKHGIYPWRVVILEGRRMPWGAGRLSAWLVPENARWPDPQASDEDEAEEEAGPEAAGAGAPPQPAPHTAPPR
jgi:hypothetical protein